MNTSSFMERFLKRARSGVRLNPARDWAILLVCSAVILVGIVVWNAWVFDTVAKGGVIGTPVTKTPAVFDRSLLSEVRAIFETRAAEEVKYRTGAYQYADPSQ